MLLSEGVAPHKSSDVLAALLMREKFYGRTGCEPAGALEHVPSGAVYLKGVGADGTRAYERKA